MQENTGYEKTYKTKPPKKPTQQQTPKREKGKPWQRTDKRAAWGNS